MRFAAALAPNREKPIEACRWACNVASVDAALGGGMAYGRVHEIYAAEVADAAAATGFALALTAGMADGNKTVLSLRSHRNIGRAGVFQANGWAELGGMPSNAMLCLAPDTITLLRTAADALRCSTLGAVIVEGWGQMRELDLTASRRLALAAEKSGVPLFLLRIDASPAPSAAQTRWQVASAPSRALPGHAPGQPTFDIELMRQRSGPCGLNWRLEWDRDQRKFREQAVSGIMAAVPVRRSTADTGPGLSRPDSRYAA